MKYSGVSGIPQAALLSAIYFQLLVLVQRYNDVSYEYARVNSCVLISRWTSQPWFDASVGGG